MRFTWFLTFWGWSKETYRSGMLLHHPLETMGAAWNEWFDNEASAADREAINEVGEGEEGQREFIQWIEIVWGRDAAPDGNRQLALYVMEELARVPPFDRWPVFSAFRAPQEECSVSALVIADGSPGLAADVRPVHAVILPVGAEAAGHAPVVADDFRADLIELCPVRQAVVHLLRGKGFARLMTRWVLTGGRAYRHPVMLALNAGWIAAGGMTLFLLFGPDPGGALPWLAAGLAILWSVLVATAAGSAITQIRAARAVACDLADRISTSQIRLQMPGRLTVKGGSAGLAFFLNTLHALGRAYPERLQRAWFWRKFFKKVESDGRVWAATGVVTKEGVVQQVETGKKLRACGEHSRIARLLVPGRSGARIKNDRTSDNAGEKNTDGAATGKDGFPVPAKRSVLVKECRHVADAVLAVGGFFSGWQTAVNGFALLVSGMVVAGFCDLVSIVFPPPAPAVVAPASPSAYFLWVSLDTKRPEFFQVVFESKMWVNRRVDVSYRTGASASTRAEIRLVRVRNPETRDFSDGLVWVERRPCFLGRKFQSRGFVGRYTVDYLNRLGHD